MYIYTCIYIDIFIYIYVYRLAYTQNCFESCLYTRAGWYDTSFYLLPDSRFKCCFRFDEGIFTAELLMLPQLSRLLKALAELRYSWFHSQIQEYVYK